MLEYYGRGPLTVGQYSFRVLTADNINTEQKRGGEQQVTS